MQDRSYWWPLDLTEWEETTVLEARAELSASKPQLDLSLLEATSDLLAHKMRHDLPEIIEKDSLPQLCHVWNGWGNSKFQGRPLLDQWEAFIHLDDKGRPFIPQCHPEGDFHAGQSFAYAIMAGVQANDVISSRGDTLSDLLRNSRSILSDNPAELGHLLFALAYADPDPEGPPVFLRNQSLDIPALMRLGIEGHYTGSFDVCRKFHMTEGICAAAARIPGLDSYRDEARSFLDGQMEMLIVMVTLRRQIKKCWRAGVLDDPDGLIEQLRTSLVLGRYLENEFYYVGHLVELAGFAESLGYPLRTEYWSAATELINSLNQVLLDCHAHLSFLDCFLHLGHYRRAITLAAELASLSPGNKALSPQHLSNYSVDFDTLPPFIESGKAGGNTQIPDCYIVERSWSQPRSAFAEATDRYAHIAPPGFEPRGRIDHFRRIGPRHWPRSLHYELLDYGKEIGVEIHLESKSVEYLRNHIHSFVAFVAAAFAARMVEWEDSWAPHASRLRILYPESASASEIAEGLRHLIELTAGSIEEIVSGVRA